MRHVPRWLALAAAPLMLIACDNDVTQADDAIDVQVTATSFSPPLLTIEPADSTAGGEDSALPITVAWEFTGGPHNIVFEDGLSSGNRTDGTFERDFSDAQAGVYRYRCTLHSSDFLTGQVGQVVVIQ